MCVRAYVRYGYRSTFRFLLLSSFIASLALSCAVQQPKVFTQLCNDGVPTVRSSRQQASVRASVCLLVGTGADRKITTADRCSASECLHFSTFATTHTHTQSPLVHHLCVCFGKISDKTTIVTMLLRGCSDSGFVTLASHAHYHGAATVLAAVFVYVCTCWVLYCLTRCNGFSCT